MYTVLGKVALITGASNGIGAAIAREFLEAGLKGVSNLDINEEAGLQLTKELNDKFGKGRAIFIKTDVSDRRQFEDAFKKTVDEFRQLDIVINNAAAKGEANWERNIAVNLTGVLNGTILAYEHYFPQYRSKDEAVIINIASLAGLYRYPPAPVYVASKSGVVGFTRSLGSKPHYERTKIKVIAVCPGYTSTAIRGIKEEDMLGPPYFKIHKQMLEVATPAQPVTAVSNAVIEVIKKGTSGSVWIAEGNQPPFEVKFAFNRQNKL